MTACLGQDMHPALVGLPASAVASCRVHAVLGPLAVSAQFWAKAASSEPDCSILITRNPKPEY